MEDELVKELQLMQPEESAKHPKLILLTQIQEEIQYRFKAGKQTTSPLAYYFA